MSQPEFDSVDATYEWKDMPKGQNKPKYEITIPGQEPFGMAAVWKLWKNLKTQLWEPTFAILENLTESLGDS